MDATQTLQNLVHQIQISCLNYKIELSPFSATVFLKKSFIKDRNGNPLTPSSPDDVRLGQIKSENENLIRKVFHQESVIESLKSDFENAVNDCEQDLNASVKSLVFDLGLEDSDLRTPT